MAKYQRLMSLCIKVLSSFDSTKCGIDDHLEACLASNEEVKDDADLLLVDEIVTGCVRYRSLIRVALNMYYAGEGKTCLKADSDLYSVISYLAMFRLKDIGITTFKRIVHTQHTAKMIKFLRFLFSAENLSVNGCVREEWNKVYDPDFVSKNVVQLMLNYIEEINDLLSDLSASMSPAKPCPKATTEIKPFDLTKPTPRRILVEVEEIPTLRPHKPVPKSTYLKPLEEETLAKEFRKNRLKAETILNDADRLQFSCAVAEKSEKTKRILEQIKAEEEERNKITMVKPVPMPSSLKESPVVKSNATVVFREGARIQKEEKVLQEKLADIEAGGGDFTPYLKWQQEMKDKAAAEQLAEIERKHLAGQISYEEAILAKQQNIQDRRDEAHRFREECRKLMTDYFSQKKEEKNEMRRLVEATAAGQQNIKEAKAKLKAMKQKIVQQMAKESQELMQKALEEEESNMRKKSELIRQIYAMEKVPIIRANLVDLTETSGMGYLSEMSIVELRERLSLMKIAEEEQMKEKRGTIKKAKEAKEQHLSATLENIAQHKLEKKRQTAMTKKDSQRIFEAHHAQLKAEKIDSLKDKLDSRRKERVRQQKLSMEVVAPASAKNYKSTMKFVPSLSSSSLPHNPPPPHRVTLNHHHLPITTTPTSPMATLVRATKRT